MATFFSGSGGTLLVPFVLGYIAWFWRLMDMKKLTKSDIDHAKAY